MKLQHNVQYDGHSLVRRRLNNRPKIANRVFPFQSAICFYRIHVNKNSDCHRCHLEVRTPYNFQTTKVHSSLDNLGVRKETHEYKHRRSRVYTHSPSTSAIDEATTNFTVITWNPWKESDIDVVDSLLVALVISNVSR